MKILLIGRNGQVGFELNKSLKVLGELVALSREELDLSNRNAVIESIRNLKPDLIVNAAAYTAVDKAEEEPELAMAVNGTAPGLLAAEAKRLGAALVHFSTDYVFDGLKKEPYSEEDQPRPRCVYGETKLAGEEAVRASGANHLILRTSWVYGLRGNNFLLTICRLAAEREELSIVSDQHGAPTWCRTIAEYTAAVLQQKPFPASTGTYHLTAAGSTTWYGFARAILSGSKLRPPNGVEPLSQPKLLAIKTKDYPTAACRPANSRLDCSKLERTFNLNLPHWQVELDKCLKESGSYS